MSNINKLATFTSNGSNLNKKEALSRLTSYVNNMSDSEYFDNRIMLSYFYDRFSTTIPAKSKTPIDILKRVMPKNDLNYYLNYIFVNGNDMVSSDGNRLSIAPNIKEYEDGFYDKNMIKVDCDGNYPDYKRVIPNTNNSILVNIKETDIVIVNGVETREIKTKEGVNIYLNIKFLNDVIDKDETFELRYITPNDFSSVIIVNKFSEMTNIIMPIAHH